MTHGRRTTLVCLPFAGSGASFFRSWGPPAGGRVEVVALQLPGRERRIDDEPYRSVSAAVDGLAPEAIGLAVPDHSLVLFGHSLGAVLAYELAHHLTNGGQQPDRLVVSGSPGPWTPRERRATGLPDDEFVLRVQEFAGYTHEALANQEMRELILPTLRADVEMHENYRPDNRAALAVPITAIRGRDDHLVSTEQAGQWATATDRDFMLVEVPGGHMYLADGPEHVLRQVEAVSA